MAAAIAADLLPKPQGVGALHGDIHHSNILDCEDRSWLAFDPKGLLRWIIAYAGLSAAWFIENGGDPGPAPGVAEIAVAGLVNGN